MIYSWVIYAAFNARIEVTFQGFDLEWSKTCLSYDSVKISDRCNGSNTWSDNLGSGRFVDGYCGNMTKFHVTSRCNKMRIVFKSDDSVTGKGFNATYRIIRDYSKLSAFPSFLPSFLSSFTFRKNLAYHVFHVWVCPILFRFWLANLQDILIVHTFFSRFPSKICLILTDF